MHELLDCHFCDEHKFINLTVLTAVGTYLLHQQGGQNDWKIKEHNKAGIFALL